MEDFVPCRAFGDDLGACREDLTYDEPATLPVAPVNEGGVYTSRFFPQEALRRERRFIV